MKQYFLVLCSLFLMIGCTTEKPDNLSDNVLTEEFYAVFESADSRTYVDDQIRMRWTAKDKITLFKKNTYNREYMFTGKTGANAGGFRQISVDDEFWFGEEVGANYAVYPHSVDTELDETDLFLTVEMPSEQTYVMNSFGLGANTMVAVSEGSQLMFKNVGSCLRIRLYGEDTSVSSITLTSKGDESISGTAKITPVLNGFPTCEMTGSGKNIRLTCPTAVAISTESDSPTDFWIVVPPVTLSKGFSVTVEDSEGATQVYDVNQSFTFKRNSYYDFKREVTINNSSTDEASIPNNQIWYTATNKVIPYTTDCFGADIVLNEWNETTKKGILTFNGNVTKIGKYAFLDCSSLTSVALPDGITSIETFAFGYCSNLKSITFPKSFISIGSQAFQGCSNIESVTLSENVMAIGHNAFNACSGELLVNCNIPDGAFWDSNFTKITIGDNVKSLPESPFMGCSKLQEFKGKFSSTDGRCLIVDGELNSFAPSGLTKYEVPLSVTKIGRYSFAHCTKLESITLSENVSKIGYAAFMGCTGELLINCNIQEGGIYESNFTKLTICEGVTHIGMSLVDVKNLKNITIPNSVTSIDENIFQGCSGELLVNCDIPNNAFVRSDFTNVIIGEGVRKIGYQAFYGAGTLESVIIPSSITIIGQMSFYGCSNLRSVYCKSLNPPRVGPYPFNGNASDRKIYVPSASVNIYKEADGWKDYADYIFADPTEN